MRALVTGATGFIGRHLVRVLLERGWRVTIAHRVGSRLGGMAAAPLRRVVWDLNDEVNAELAEALAGSEVVFHVGGLIKALDARRFYAINTEPTVRLYEACKGLSNVRRFVYFSSQAAAGPAPTSAGVDESHPPRPVCHYGRSKLAAEVHIRARAHTPFTILRPSVVFGVGDPETKRLLDAARRGFVLAVPGRLKLLSLVSVADVVEAAVTAATAGAARNRTFFLADPEPLPAVVFQASLARARVRRLNAPAAAIAALCFAGHALGSLSGTVPSLNLHKLPHLLQRWWVCRPEALMNACNWRPRENVRAALRRFAQTAESASDQDM